MKRCNLIILLVFTLISCTDSPIKESVFFDKSFYDTSRIMRQFFKVNEIHLDESVYGYNHEFSFWKGYVNKNGQFISSLGYRGNIFLKNRIIFLVPEGVQDTIKYFDFNAKIGEKRSMDLKFRKLDVLPMVEITKHYDFELEDKFIDRELKDTVFKFRFNNIGAFINNDDLVFYVSLKYGVLGIYNAFRDAEKEEILSYRGNIYKALLDSNKVIFIPDRSIY